MPHNGKITVFPLMAHAIILINKIIYLELSLFIKRTMSSLYSNKVYLSVSKASHINWSVTFELFGDKSDITILLYNLNVSGPTILLITLSEKFCCQIREF